MEARLDALHELISSRMHERRMNVERLASLSEIPEHYLKALLEGDYSALPPRPYVRGYLVKLAEVLDLDEDELLALQHKDQLGSAGASDTLPGKRYTAPKINLRWLITGIVILAIIAYGVFFSISSGTPYLELEVPPPGSDPHVSQTAMITLEGSIEPGDSLFISGSEVAVDEAGLFRFEYELDPELNNIEFRVKRFLGKEITVTRQVFYQRAIQIETDQLEESSEQEALDSEE
ncbi:MAG: helix-turn-helix domain-containing protein [Candidatus Harrisonbacteria bacterium]|nr:helix-turn-helix domain-containing protein [Candidatus Harrisonbacteria bacterium]